MSDVMNTLFRICSTVDQEHQVQCQEDAGDALDRIMSECADEPNGACEEKMLDEVVSEESESDAGRRLALVREGRAAEAYEGLPIDVDEDLDDTVDDEIDERIEGADEEESNTGACFSLCESPLVSQRVEGEACFRECIAQSNRRWELHLEILRSDEAHVKPAPDFSLRVGFGGDFPNANQLGVMTDIGMKYTHPVSHAPDAAGGLASYDVGAECGIGFDIAHRDETMVRPHIGFTHGVTVYATPSKASFISVYFPMGYTSKQRRLSGNDEVATKLVHQGYLAIEIPCYVGSGISITPRGQIDANSELINASFMLYLELSPGRIVDAMNAVSAKTK